MPWLFLLAYTCSGLAGLVYEVSWTRLLTLYIGHTTAAASAVVGAFLGGLAVGAGAGGAVASRLSPHRALQAYVGLELGVAVAALLLPLELSALRPVLAWAYNDGATGPLFSAVRLLACLLMVFVPSTALGATFPMAIRWFAHESDNPARSAGALYVVNTAGAAVGALLAGFILIPTIGVSGATWAGVAASTVAAAGVLVLVRVDSAGNPKGLPPQAGLPPPASSPLQKPRAKRSRTSANRLAPSGVEGLPAAAPRWLAVVVLGLSGFAALLHEIAWTRILALVLGPTTYAFAATLAVVIAGVAVGSGAGAWVVSRTRRPAAWLAFALAAAAVTASWTSSIAGTRVPLLVAQQVAATSADFEQLLLQGALLTVGLVMPTAACLGAAFPLALAVVSDPSIQAAGRFGLVYAVNTLCAVSGSLAAGFLFIPWLGLRSTLVLTSALLITAALAVVAWGALSKAARATSVLATAAAAALVIMSPPWDRGLLASGVYMYAPFVPADLDLATQLKAGEVLYYREGASATVSVKRLTGTTTLAVDGKTDASNRGDMITQKLIAHIPLLLHENPRDVAIIGLGSGVTVGSALRHPIARADVVEISSEVVEASRFFEFENHRALADPRTNLIVGDGRSHLMLSGRTYDVIISEPSNPWMAGVASLFTREFFEGARARLAPGGIMCQWANAYNISDVDLRAIVATFRSVFPDGTVWLVGESDVLMVASDGPLDARLANIERHWGRPGVADDLRLVSVLEPFSVWSLFMAGPAETARYAQGAAILTDDRMSLEFSSPREIHRSSGGADNMAALSALLGDGGGPAVVREARAEARASHWRNRGTMMARADLPQLAYDDYVRALALDPADKESLEGLVHVAVLARRGAEGLEWMRALPAERQATTELLVARSKLLVSVDAAADALEPAREAALAAPGRPEPLEQLASLYADAGDTVRLDRAVADLQQVAPTRAPTYYYAAVAAHLHGDAAEAVRLAGHAIAADPSYQPVYDLLGAAQLRLGQAAAARDAFLKAIALDSRDSTAYTNLGLIELAAGNRAVAANYFAESLWLEPESPTARQGLAQARGF